MHGFRHSVQYNSVVVLDISHMMDMFHYKCFGHIHLYNVLEKKMD